MACGSWEPSLPMPLGQHLIQTTLKLMASGVRKAAMLAGLRLSVKESFAVRGVRHDAGSRTLGGAVAEQDATVVARLRAAGAVVLAEPTRMDEFGMGSLGPADVDNPKRPGHCAGGSSAGAAASVAGGTADLALASDTGGSSRLPAAWCGVVALKPTYGALSRLGLIPYAASLDTPALMARDVGTAARGFVAAAGRDEGDATTRDSDTMGVLAALAGEGGKPLRIAAPAEFAVEELDDVVRQAWDAALGVFGAQGVEVPAMPAILDALPAYYVLASAEAASNLARYDGGVRYGAGDGRTRAARSCWAQQSASAWRRARLPSRAARTMRCL